MQLAQLCQDVQHEINGRTRGRQERLLRLQAAGAPVGDRWSLMRWRDSQFDAARPGAVYHACTVRQSSGTDADLPHRGPYGCRVTRVPVAASYYATGYEFTDADPIEEPLVIVHWGSCGPGYMEPRSLPVDSLVDFHGLELTGDEAVDSAAACELAERVCRDSLLRRGDCFATFAEARAAVETMLADRALRHRRPL